MNIKDIIESINLLTEEGIGEETLQDIPEEEPEVAPEFNDSMSLADTFDTKAKIARCLDNLKVAIEEFKEATSEKVDLLKDELLLQSIEELDEVTKAIELALASGSNMLGDSELNDAFKNELPQAAEEEEVEEEPKEEPVEPTEEETEEDEDVEYDFDSEAGYDLLGGEV